MQLVEDCAVCGCDFAHNILANECLQPILPPRVIIRGFQTASQEVLNQSSPVPELARHLLPVQLPELLRRNLPSPDYLGSLPTDQLAAIVDHRQILLCSVCVVFI